MRKLLISFLICLIPTLLFAENTWTKKDTAYQATFLILQTVDWLQTKEIARNPRYYEQNPILGKYPSQNAVDFYFLSTAIAHSAVAYLLPKEYRRVWQCVFIGISAHCVARNYHIGIRINF